MEITLEKIRPTLAEQKKIKLAAEGEARETIVAPPVRQLTMEEILAEENRSSDEESEWAACDFWRKREQIHEEKMAEAAATPSSSKKGKRDIYNEYDARGEFEELIEEIMRERRAGNWTSDEKIQAEFRKKRLAKLKRELSDERSKDFNAWAKTRALANGETFTHHPMEIVDGNPTDNLVEAIWTEKVTTNLAAP